MEALQKDQLLRFVTPIGLYSLLIALLLPVLAYFSGKSNLSDTILVDFVLLGGVIMSSAQGERGLPLRMRCIRTLARWTLAFVLVMTYHIIWRILQLVPNPLPALQFVGVNTGIFAAIAIIHCFVMWAGQQIAVMRVQRAWWVFANNRFLNGAIICFLFGASAYFIYILAST